MALLPHVQLAETVKPEGHKLGADLWLRQFLTGNLGFQFLFRGFQFFQALYSAVDIVTETVAGAGEAGNDAGEFDVYEFIAERFCVLHPEVFAQKSGCGQIVDDSGDNFFADNLQCG